MEFLFFLGLFLIGLVCGRINQRKHFAEIRAREAQAQSIPVITFGAKQSLPDDVEGRLFVGSVVVSADYFKIVVGAIQNLTGGRMVEFETVMERARREAMLRMKEPAIAWGATQIANVRLETSSLGSNSQNGIVAVEVFAYGTAIRPMPRQQLTS